MSGMRISPWARNCLLCRAPVTAGTELCPACELALPRTQRACPCCGTPGAAAGTAAACGACQRHPPAYDATRAVFRYAAPVDRLIQRLKYHGRLELSRLLGDCLARHLLALDEPRPDVLLPVPLHRSRLRERGYNQSLEIARFVARALRIPLARDGARRVRATAPQMELPRDRRRRNMRGAFETDGRLRGRRIAIVDDVMTSGHTVNALAECLRRSGAEEIRVWVVARA